MAPYAQMSQWMGMGRKRSWEEEPFTEGKRRRLDPEDESGGGGFQSLSPLNQKKNKSSAKKRSLHETNPVDYFAKRAKVCYDDNDEDIAIVEKSGEEENPQDDSYAFALVPYQSMPLVSFSPLPNLLQPAPALPPANPDDLKMVVYSPRQAAASLGRVMMTRPAPLLLRDEEEDVAMDCVRD